MTATDTAEQTDIAQLRRELLLEQALKAELDHLVKLAARAVLTLTTMQRSAMEESQLRNLVSVAADSQSVEVTANFIRYQIARKPHDWGMSKNEFGHTVIQQLYGLAGTAEEIASRVAAQVGQPAATMQRSAHLRLVDLYLGYLSRTFYYYKKSRDAKQGADAVAQLEGVAQ